MQLIKSFNRFFCGLATLVAFLASTVPAHAVIVEDVSVRSRSTGYEIQFRFFLPLRYESHSPGKEGDVLVVQLRTVSSLGFDDTELLQELRKREILSWDRSIPVPIKELTYEGDTPDRPTLTLRFNEAVKFDVRSSADFRSLIVNLKADKKAAPEPPAAAAPTEAPLHETDLTGVPQKIAELMETARLAMVDEDYRRAVQLYTKILRLPDSPAHADAQEFLALARERNRQLAHAKAEYEKYLSLYPKGPGADRVRQRLLGLVTAAAKPRERLKTAEPAAEGASPWDSRVYGSLSMFYNHDVTEPDNGEAVVNRSDLATHLDFNTRLKSDRYDLRFQFVGSDDYDFRDGEEGNETRVSILSLEGKDLRHGLYGRVGRQTQSSGGVLGRFDGAYFSYDLTRKVKWNTVLGFPAPSSSSAPVDTERKFYGVNFDFSPFSDRWNFNTFFIDQYVDTLTDRRAVGLEVRYFDPRLAFFSLVDYDISYNDLNLFLMNGNYTFPTKTRLSLVLDYRKSPLLATSNAMQGQGVEEFSDLLKIFSEDEIRDLARDRTARSTSGTFGITQDLNANYQLSFEVTASELSGTPASGGVEANPGTGVEFFYSTQLIGTNLFTEGDVTILGLRYFDTMNHNSYSAIINTRFSINRDFRVNPRVQFEYRENKDGGGDRFNVRPLLRLDYRLTRWLRLETEGGMEWTRETALGEDERSRGYFFALGFRADF